jgi:putative nucleotidyltransferase with HDIG domain
MPQIAGLVMEKAADPNTTPKELNTIISRDQGMALRVLKMANSAFYGRSKSVTRLTDAILVVGFSTIQSLVMTAAVRDLFKTFGLLDQLLWEHSLGCAFAARTIARRSRFPRVEEAFLAGLLHDVGKVILNIKAPEKMSLIVQQVYNNPGKRTFYELERQAFGFDHAQLGELLARKWNFAGETEFVIGNHQMTGTGEGMPRLLYIVHLANGICHKLGIGPTRTPDLNLADLKSARIFNMEEAVLEDLAKTVAESYASDKDSGCG